MRRAARIADRITDLEDLIDTEGEMIPGSVGQMVLHPGFAEIRQLEKLTADLLARISFSTQAQSAPSGRERSEKARHAALVRHHGGRVWG